MKGKIVFCANCGAGDQAVESYCKRCGEWLPNPKASRGMLRMHSPEEKIRRIRILEAISAGLSLTAFGVIVSVISDPGNIGMLFLAAICCILVTVYQVINFYLGYKVHNRAPRGVGGGETGELHGHLPQRELNTSTASSFSSPGSVTDETTKLLEPLPGQSQRDRER